MTTGKDAACPTRTAPVVFLAHSSGDKEYVRDVHRLLSLDGYSPWLDEANLVPGQEWEMEVEAALKTADAIVVFLSAKAMTDAGYVNKEIRIALDIAERLPQGAIHVIPMRLDDHEVPPKLRHLHWIDSFHALWEPAMTKRLYTTTHFKQFGVLRTFSIGDQYRQLQRGALVGSGKSDPHSDPGFHDSSDDDIHETRQLETEYLVRGKYPSGDRYYGRANLRIDRGQSVLTTRVRGESYEYKCADTGVCLRFSGPHAVEYWRSPYGDLLVGTWGNGGLEELIPARHATD